MKVQLRELAHARSGDKGDITNIGVIPNNGKYYKVLKEKLTAEKVKEHFAGICLGEVERYELPNLEAFNFLLHESLNGGGSISLRTDAQGKTYGAALLKLELELDEEVLE